MKRSLPIILSAVALSSCLTKEVTIAQLRQMSGQTDAPSVFYVKVSSDPIGVSAFETGGDAGNDTKASYIDFCHEMCRISVKAKSLPNRYGHTIRVRAVRIGSSGEGENFYSSGMLEMSSVGIWSECMTNDDEPLTFSLDERHFNSNASSLPADYEDIVDESSSIFVIPQDFSSAGLPVEVDFSIMDGESVIMDDTLKCRFAARLNQGKTYSIYFDLTPVPITFDVTVDPWEEVNI